MRQKSKTDYVRYAAVVILVISLMAIALLLLNYWEKQQGFFQGEEKEISLQQSIVHDGKKYALRTDIETILFIGVDKFSNEVDYSSYNNDQQADFLMLMVIDRKKGTASAIQFNRDTIAEMDILGIGGRKVGTINAQLALSHTYGSGGKDSCFNTKKAISRFLGGVYIDHYIALTMDSVQIINDLVGGVTLEVLHDFSKVDPSLVKGETVTLQGEKALTYIRGRKDVDEQSNMQRMERQNQYLQALKTQVKSYANTNKSFSSDAVIKLADHMVTDYSFDLLDDVLEKMLTYDITEIHKIEGELKRGEKHMEFYADAKAKKQLVVDLFYRLSES